MREMSEFIIRGGNRLTGSIKVQGAKNSVLPILAATLLTNETCVIHNCPRLSDVDISVQILRHLGCQVAREDNTVTVEGSGVCRGDVPEQLMRKMRSSIVFLGAIIGRTGMARMSAPGGCELGNRPIDLHMAALRRLGVNVDETGGFINCCCSRPRGCEITLGFPSVGATENIMLTASLASGRTVVRNAAREPEICDLAEFINKMGGRISGAGESTVAIEGVPCLHGCEHTVIPDRIVSATIMSAAAVTNGDVELTNMRPEHVSPIITALEEMGCSVTGGDTWCRIKAPERLAPACTVRTMPYPGFPTDAQAPLMAAAAVANGTTVFIESIFDSRYKHVAELNRLGAKISTDGRTAVVCGVSRLTGAAVESTDLRGGAALVVAGLNAYGETRVGNICHIDRGYEFFEKQIYLLGGDIVRV